ncbi:RHS repeat domain-containing protein [Flavobacterium silvaticum]|uniref:RHS repeat protein n=1 Tax=Flavobacterium silvaticum TaxID=1852020 RepID=A0A972JG55_9FLAO|nr:RHS repeat domain-containing protein [Flavobacterium silvaticum]NMH26505.1 RHS repeat protein [Flavobacterium silvaticum]
MYRIFSIIVILVNFMPGCGYAQHQEISIPSPEATAVFKNSEIPTSLYNGLPTIDIPLLEIESGGVKVPISVSYHARGVLVAEVASRVGTGWNLNCGGMVMHQKRGLSPVPDRKYYNLDKWCPDYPAFYSDVDKRMTAAANQDVNGVMECDMVSDQYSFSINGMSGKFIWDEIGEKWVIQKYGNYSIVPPYVNILSGNITPGVFKDGSGNTYMIGENNKADVEIGMEDYVVHTDGDYDVLPPSPHASISSWPLTKIITKTKDTIYFNYSSEHSYYIRRTSDTDALSSTQPTYSTATNLHSTQQRLDSITYPQGKVRFIYSSTPREDLQNSQSLERIIYEDINNNVIKKILFTYEYQESEDDGNINFRLVNDTYAYKRLFLKSIQVLGAHDEALPPYEFTYSETQLPSRHSNAVDVWGYYNGKNNGKFLESWKDRSVDEDKSLAGLLTEIKKPEGGKTVFTYEHNRVVNPFPDTVDIGDSNPSVHYEVSLSTIQHTMNDTLTGNPIYDGFKYRKTFNVGPFVRGSKCKYKLWGAGVGNCPALPPDAPAESSTCFFSFALYKFDNYTNDYEYFTPLRRGEDIPVHLEPGNYMFVATPLITNHNPLDSDEFFLLHLSWFEEDTELVPPLLVNINDNCIGEDYTGTTLVYGPGKRIKKIEYFDSDNSNAASFKTYEYKRPYGQPSGFILGLANVRPIQTFDLNGQTATLQTVATSVYTQLSGYQSNCVGYDYVTEYFGDHSNNLGRVDYQYSMVFDSGRYYEFPFHPSTDNEWLRGKELKVTYYKKVADSLQIIKTIENKYLLGGVSNLFCDNPFVKPPIYKNLTEDIPSQGGHLNNRRIYNIPQSIPGLPGDEGGGPSGLRYMTYYLTGGTFDLESSITTDYFDDNSSIITSTQFEYDYDHHYNMASKSIINSSGQSVKTKYFYPGNDDILSTEIDNCTELVQESMLDVPLRTQEFRDATLLSQQDVEYEEWTGQNGDYYAPKQVRSKKGSSPYGIEPKFEYVSYDLWGNPTEMKVSNGKSISYIWGKQHSLVLAKIENISITQIPATLISSIQAASDSGNENNLIIALNNLRADASMADSMVTTYTYTQFSTIASITDPKGLKISYHYDSFGRLVSVKDANGKLLTETQYHYKLQP